MPVLRRRALPNAITVGRIVMAPAIFFLILAPGFWSRLLSFILFLIAAFSDLWDGYLARKHGWVSDFGKLMDPIADKLLLVVTFIPFYMLSHGPAPGGELPYWDTLPLWVLLVIFGREALVTGLRAYAARQGVVLAAGKAGKHKAVVQNVFIGSALLWYALQSGARSRGWTGPLWELWQAFHGVVLATALAVAIFLTVYSLWIYLRGWRKLAQRPG